MTQTPLIPRNVLFGNPDKLAARLSPDGARLAYLGPVDGVLNIWVGPTADPSQARPVTRSKNPIRQYQWAYTNQHILYLQDTDGDENNHLFAVDLESDATRDLTPIKGVATILQAASELFPEEVVVGLNDRDPGNMKSNMPNS